MKKLDKNRRLKRDSVVSGTARGWRVGVYYADTDGSEILLSTTPEKADKIIARHNKGKVL